MTSISAVVPVYGCADCLNALDDRLRAALTELTADWEIVYVDDRSPDGAWPLLEQLAATSPRVRAVRLSRNFGQSLAITAGIAEARGDWIVLLDCDLQDDPADIRLLVEGADGGDLVFSRRTQREQSAFRRVAARAYFKLRNRLLGLTMDAEHGSLILLSRRVAEEYLRIRDRDRHHAIALHWLGFEQRYVDVAHHPRHGGRSSYTLRKLIASAVGGLFFQTSVLLRWIVYAGLAVVTFGLLLAVALVALYFAAHPYPGWTSLAVLILLVGGFIIASTGIAAVYVGKIFEQVKERPLYIVDRVVGRPDDE